MISWCCNFRCIMNCARESDSLLLETEGQPLSSWWDFPFFNLCRANKALHSKWNWRETSKIPTNQHPAREWIHLGITNYHSKSLVWLYAARTFDSDGISSSLCFNLSQLFFLITWKSSFDCVQWAIQSMISRHHSHLKKLRLFTDRVERIITQYFIVLQVLA